MKWKTSGISKKRMHSLKNYIWNGLFIAFGFLKTSPFPCATIAIWVPVSFEPN
jgi:hypothetical protein